MGYKGLAFLFVLSGACAATQVPLGASFKDNLLDEELDRAVEWGMQHFQIPGLAISVVHEDEIFAKGYGLSDVDAAIPVSENTLFFGGSTTKAMTAAAISLLVDDNKNYPSFQWNTLVHSIIPDDFALIDPWYTTHVTVTDMLTHRSGLPRHDFLLLENSTAKEMVRKIRHLPITADIRTEWQYCNLMYVTAAHVIESVTGQTLQSFFKEKIWGPLDMDETYISLGDAEQEGKPVSQGYYVDFLGQIASTGRIYSENVKGAGNILTSVQDYAKWVSNLLRRGHPFTNLGYSFLLGAHSIANPQSIYPFTSADLYAMGWVLQTYRGEPILQHGGAQYGYGAAIIMVPNQKLGITILGNNMLGTNLATNMIAYHIIDRVLGVPKSDRFDWVRPADELLKNATLTNSTLHNLYPDLPNILLPHPLDLSSYTGTYVHPAYPELILSTSCPDRDFANEPDRWTGARICASLAKPVALPSPLTLDLFHITDTFWTLVQSLQGEAGATRAEFKLTPQGNVSHIGIEIEAQMARKREKIWWERVSH